MAFHYVHRWLRNKHVNWPTRAHLYTQKDCFNWITINSLLREVTVSTVIFTEGLSGCLSPHSAILIA